MKNVDRTLETVAARRARMQAVLDREVTVHAVNEPLREVITRLCGEVGLEVSFVGDELVFETRLHPGALRLRPKPSTIMVVPSNDSVTLAAAEESLESEVRSFARALKEGFGAHGFGTRGVGAPGAPQHLWVRPLEPR